MLVYLCSSVYAESYSAKTAEPHNYEQAIPKTNEVTKVRVNINRTKTANNVYKDITLSTPGTLASELGDDINDIDSLVVRGPINAADFHTIWSCSFYGGLTVANLEYAQIAGNRTPKNAFWYQSVQYTPDPSI